MNELRHQVWEVFEGETSLHRVRAIVHRALILLIVANVIAILLESVESLAQPYWPYFQAIEYISVALFTIEYVLRVWSSAEAGSRLRYVLSPLALIDLLAILPTYAATLIGLDLRFLRAIRLFRLLKLVRYFAPLAILGDVLKAEARALGASLMVMVILVVFAANAIYLAERHVQADVFGSIPAAIWWAVVTLTTVGYGDVTPVTMVGRIVGMAIMIMGVGMVALPAGMLASRFSEELRKRRRDFEQAAVRSAEDGLTDQERAELESLRERLCLSEDDVRHVLEAADTGPQFCPHCGQATGP